MQKLSQSQIDATMKRLKDWSQVGETIQRTYQFVDFVTSMRFVDGVAAQAEADKHHPDMLIRYHRVTMTLSTHDAGGITEKDTDAATKYDEIAKKLAPVMKKKERATG